MSKPIPSKAAIKGHPLHPMLIPFPIALLSAALLADVVYAFNSERGWAVAAAWLVGGGLVMGAVAATAGATDFFARKEVRKHKTAKRHAIGNAMILVLALINLLIRLPDPADAVVPWGLVLSAVIGAIMTYTGWLGGELSYKHMIGVNPHMAGAPVKELRQEMHR